jgi:uncharacterized membrane protein
LLVAAVRMSEMAFWVVWLAERKIGEAWQAATRSLVDILSIMYQVTFEIMWFVFSSEVGFFISAWVDLACCYPKLPHIYPTQSIPFFMIMTASALRFSGRPS